MPQVPDYGGMGKVEARPIPTPYSNLNPDTGLGDLAKGLNQLGDAADHIEKKRQEAAAKADAIAANDALTRYQNDNISALDGSAEGGQKAPPADAQSALDQAYENGGAPAGYLNTRGKDAAAAAKDTLDYLDQRRKEIADGLTNEKQRQLFNQHSASVFLNARERVERHTNQQLKEVEVDSLKGRMATTLSQISNDYADDKGAEQASEAVAQTLRAFHGPMGDADASVQAWKQEVATTRLNRFIGAKDWQGAENLFSRVKAELGPHTAQFEKTIQTLKQDQEGEGIAAKLVDEARSPENGRVDAAKAYAGLDAIQNVQLRDEVRGRIAHRVQVAEHDWTQKVAGVADLALTDYIQGGNNLYAINSNAKAWLIQNAPDQWRRIEMMAHQDREQAAHGEPPTPAQQAAMTAFQVDAADHPEKYATMPVSTFNATVGVGLARQDRERAGQLLAHYHQQANKPEKLPPLQDRMLLQMGREAGVFPAGKGTNDISQWTDDAAAQLYYRAEQELTEQAAQYHRTTGKEAPLDEVKRWVAEKFLRGTVPGTGVLGVFKQGTTQLESQLKGTGFEPKWTDEQKTAATQALKNAKVPVTDAAVDTLLRRLHRLPAAPVSATPQNK